MPAETQPTTQKEGGTVAPTANGNPVTRARELVAYRKWQDETQSPTHEAIGMAHWFIGLWLPWTCGLYCLISSLTSADSTLAVGTSLQTLVFLGLIQVVAHPFHFIFAHVYVHTQMYEAWENGIISVPWAYFHHYVDPTVYSKYPYNYRTLYLTLMWFHLAVDLALYRAFGDMLGLSFEMQQLMALVKYAIPFMDMMTHEYYHTKKSAYTSWNPLSARFVGVGFLFSVFGALGFVDREHHKKHHIPATSNEMEHTHYWVDLNMCHWAGDLAEKFADWLYKVKLDLHTGMFNGKPNHFFFFLHNIEVTILKIITMLVASCVVSCLDSSEVAVVSAELPVAQWFLPFVDVRANILCFSLGIKVVSSVYARFTGLKFPDGWNFE